MTTEPQSSDYRYWAFITYSHADEKFVAWLHARLEGYRVPRALVGHKHPDGVVPARLTPIFRDRNELPSAADLGAKVRRALGHLVIDLGDDVLAEANRMPPWFMGELLYGLSEVGRRP